MKKGFPTLTMMATFLCMTASAHPDALCPKEAQAAGEDFVVKYMDAGVIPAKTIVSLESQTEEDSVAYVVTTINHDATRIRSVVVRVNPGQICKIRSLEAID